MKHYTRKAYDKDIHIFECSPSEGIPVLMMNKNRSYLEGFKNEWFEKRGYKLVEITNLSLFGYSENGKPTTKSLPYGTTMNNKGHWINKPYISEYYTAMVYTNNQYIIDDFTDENKYPDAYLMFGGFPCVRDGRIDRRKWNKTAHLYTSQPRTIKGQKHDGTLVSIVTDGRTDKGLTAQQCALFCISLEIKNAVIVDGGGSSQQKINGKHQNENRRPVATALGFYSKMDFKIEGDEKMDLIIDPGHGGKDGGGGSNQYWLEKDKALEISLYQYKRFKDLGVNVSLTRDKDVYLGSKDRTSLIKNSGAKYCISNHLNSCGADGAETIHSIYSKGEMAYEIAEQLKKDGQNIRRVFTRTLPNNKKRDYYYLHRDTGAVDTTIIEYAFADSTKDDVEQILNYWKYYAEAIVEGYCKVTGIKYIPNEYTLIPKDNDELEILQQENIMLKEKVKDYEKTIQKIKDLANRML